MSFQTHAPWFASLLVLSLPLSVSAEEVQAYAVSPDTPELGVGVRLRYAFAPQKMLTLIADHATSMRTLAIGGEVVRRKGDFDLIFGLEYMRLSSDPGYYLSKGNDPAVDGPDYYQFDGVSLLGWDATFAWSAAIVDSVQLRYGVGLGLALVSGDVLKADAICDPGTEVLDLDDVNTSKCHKLAQPTAANSLPPILPVVNVMLGLRIRVADRIWVNVEGGFKDMLYAGIGSNYMF